MNNTKLKKVFTIILVCIIAVLVITAGILYFINPTATLNTIHKVWDFINEPLPVLGFSIAFICFFAWKIFISTSFGLKKYNEIKRDYAILHEILENYITNHEIERGKFEAKINELKLENQALLVYITKIRDAIPNKKVKEIEVEELYGEEKENDQAETN